MHIQQRSVGPTVYLDLHGRLVTTDQDGTLRNTVSALFEEGRRSIVLNLEDVSQVDTSGLSAMVAVRQAADRCGAQVKLLNLPARVHSLLVVTKLITLFDVIESEADATRA
jgi:anti-sigma B factor antagonist